MLHKLHLRHFPVISGKWSDPSSRIAKDMVVLCLLGFVMPPEAIPELLLDCACLNGVAP